MSLKVICLFIYIYIFKVSIFVITKGFINILTEYGKIQV